MLYLRIFFGVCFGMLAADYANGQTTLCTSNGPGVVHVKIYMTVNGWSGSPLVCFKPDGFIPEAGFSYQGPGTYLALERDYQNVEAGYWSVSVLAEGDSTQQVYVPSSAGKEIWLTFSGVGGNNWFNWDPVDEHPEGGCQKKRCVRNAGCRACAPGKVTAGLGSLDLEISLGQANYGESAGSLFLKSTAPDPSLATPAALKLGRPQQVSVVRSNTALRQVLAPQCLADIVTVNDFKYEIRLHSPDPNQVDGLYPTNGTAFSTIIIENPAATTNDVSQLRVTADGRVSEYTWNTTQNRWELTTGNGLRRQAKSSVWEAGGTVRVDTNEVWAGGGWQIESLERWQVLDSRTNLIERIVDPTGQPLTNLWSYCTEVPTNDARFGLLGQRIEPSGYWERFEYEASARRTKTVTQAGNAPTNALESACRVITNLYASTAPHRTTITYLLGQEIARRYQITNTAQTVDIRCQSAGAAWSAAENLVTSNQTYASGPFAEQDQSTRHPDGTFTLQQYAIANGLRTTTTWRGAGSATAITNGTRTIRTVDLAGNLRSETVLDIASGLQIGAQQSLTNDLHGRPLLVTSLTGTNETTYGCCGVTWTRDAEGLGTYYGYDSLQRLITTHRAGIVTSNVFDHADRLVASFRNGTLVQSNAYDLAGRLLSATDALGLTTTYTESRNANGETVKTTTSPDNSTRIETFYMDGQLKSLTGSAVHGVRYEYGVEQEGGAYRQYTKETKLTTEGTETTEWTKTYTDMLGRAYKTVRSDGALLRQALFNNQGQLIQETDADGVTLLYGYNDLGERTVTALDMDRNGQIGGLDRITSNATSVLATDLGVTQRSVTWHYSEAGAVLVATAETSADGLRTRGISFGLTNATVTALDRPNATRTVTATAPDGTQTTSVFEDGRVITVTTSHPQLGTLSSAGYTYDSLGRQSSVSDGRNVATAYAYDAADRPIAITNAVGLTEQQVTRFIFDEPNRRRITVLPDGGSVTNEYYATGELKKSWGTRTYPVEYEYDHAGRMKTLKTWQDYANDTGAAITTWTYAPQTGYLLNKRHADNTGPDYSYTPAGRLLTRTWARGILTTYTNNAAGELLGITYSDSTPAVSFTYDRRGRRTAVNSVGSVVQYQHNDAGQLLTETYTAGPLAGIVLTNAYDSLHRRSSLSYGGAGVPPAAVSYGYDPASRLVSVAQASLPVPLSASYAYTPHLPGLVSNLTFSAGGTNRLTTTKTYDNLNRLTEIRSDTPSLSTVNRHLYTYSAANQRTQCTDADGSYWQYGYDSLGQVTNAVRRWSDNAPVSGQQYGYQFDDIGNRQRSEVSGQRSDYGANILNQYESRTVPGFVNVTGLASNAATVSVGNVRATRQGDYFHAAVPLSNTTSAVYTGLVTMGVLKNAGSNQMDVVATKTGTVFVAQSPEQFTHDADGNVTCDGRWQYIWDAENRLVGMETLTNLPASVPRQRLEFAYDASFRRISKKVYAWNAEGWQLTDHRRFLHSGWNLMAELDETNGVARSYLWGNDLSGTPNGMAGLGGLLAMQSATTGTHIALSDGNGHVTALVAAEDGARSAQYEYGVFGEPVRVSGPAAASNPIRYASKYWDVETGLIAYPFRWYDPLTGRWRSRDPIGESGGANLHGFVNNDPINFVDPTGEHPALLIAIGLLWLASEQVAWAPTGQETAEQIRAVERDNLVGNARTMSMVVALPCSALAGTVTRTGLTRVLGEEALRGTGARVVAWGGQTLAEGATFGALVNVSGQVASGRWDSRSFVEETALSAGGWVLLKGIGTVVMQGGRQVLQRFEFSGQNAQCLCVEAAKTPTYTQLEFPFARGARVQTPGVTAAGERFVRVGANPKNLKFTFKTPGGVQPGTYAFPESTFNAVGRNPAALKNLGDLPGAAPQYYRILQPPAGTPIQRGIVPGGQYGGVGGVEEVIFPGGF